MEFTTHGAGVELPPLKVISGCWRPTTVDLVEDDRSGEVFLEWSDGGQLPVEDTKGCLTEFIVLANSEPRDVHAFAKKWGTLCIWPWWNSEAAEDDLQRGRRRYRDPVRHYQLLAKLMDGLLTTTDKMRQGQPLGDEDYKLFGMNVDGAAGASKSIHDYLIGRGLDNWLNGAHFETSCRVTAGYDGKGSPFTVVVCPPGHGHMREWVRTQSKVHRHDYYLDGWYRSYWPDGLVDAKQCPSGLFAVLVLHMLSMITSTKRDRRCKVCGTWFKPSRNARTICRSLNCKVENASKYQNDYWNKTNYTMIQKARRQEKRGAERAANNIDR